MPALTLQELEDDMLIIKKIYDQATTKVEFILTQTSIEFLPLINGSGQ